MAAVEPSLPNDPELMLRSYMTNIFQDAFTSKDFSGSCVVSITGSVTLVLDTGQNVQINVCEEFSQQPEKPRSEEEIVKKDLPANTVQCIYVCYKCTARFPVLTELQDHMKTQHNIKVHTAFHGKCNFCSVTFSSKIAYQKHLRHKHSEKTSQWTCQTCDKLCISDKDFQEHVEHGHCNAKSSSGRHHKETDSEKKGSKHSKNCKGISANSKEGHTAEVITADSSQSILRNLLENKLHVSAKDNMGANKINVCSHCGASIIDKCDYCESRKSGGSSALASRPDVNVSEQVRRSVVEELVHQGFTQRSAGRTNAQRPRWTCDACGKSFTTKSSFLRHVNAHAGIFRYMCSHCNRGFQQKHNLEAHVNRHLKVKPYGCSQCSKGFRSAVMLRYHEKNWHSHDNLQCDACGNTFRTKYGWLRHKCGYTKKKQIDKNVTHRQCPYCKRVVKTSSYHSHVYNFHKKPKGPHVCSICNAVYRTLYHYRKHLAQHNGAKLHVCDICSKVFRSFPAYRDHKNIHAGLRPYKCSFCPATFANRNSYRDHVNRHDNSLHACNVCGKIFYQDKNLRTHQRRVHKIIRSGAVGYGHTLLTQKQYEATHQQQQSTPPAAYSTVELQCTDAQQADMSAYSESTDAQQGYMSAQQQEYMNVQPQQIYAHVQESYSNEPNDSREEIHYTTMECVNPQQQYMSASQAYMGAQQEYPNTQIVYTDNNQTYVLPTDGYEYIPISDTSTENVL